MKRVMMLLMLLTFSSVVFADNNARLAELLEEQGKIENVFRQLQAAQRKQNEKWVMNQGAIAELRRQDAEKETKPEKKKWFGKPEKQS